MMMIMKMIFIILKEETPFILKLFIHIAPPLPAEWFVWGLIFPRALLNRVLQSY